MQMHFIINSYRHKHSVRINAVMTLFDYVKASVKKSPNVIFR